MSGIAFYVMSGIKKLINFILAITYTSSACNAPIGCSEEGDTLLVYYNRRSRWGPRSVEMDTLPLAISPLPNSGLLALLGVRHALFVEVLSESDVGNTGGVVTKEVYVGVHDHGVDSLTVLAYHIIEIELVELQSF